MGAVAVGMIALGALLVYAGMTGESIVEASRRVLNGEAGNGAPATGSGSSGSSKQVGTIPKTGAPATGTVGALLSWARSQLGKPYVWGATGPDAYDCSGFTQAAFRSVGKSIPRTTTLQLAAGRAVSRDQLAPGDLVFPKLGHVGIYTGGGKIIHAPRTGKPVAEVPLWAFFAARRVL